MIKINHAVAVGLVLAIFAGAGRLDEFEKLYSLADGEDVKILRGLAIEARNEHFEGKASQIGMGNLDTSGRQHVTFRWRDGKRRWTSTSSSINSEGMDLRSALSHILGVQGQEIEGDASLFNAFVPGDYLIRDGVGVDKLVPELEAILRRDLEIPVKLKLMEEMRDVVVASGRYHYQPDPLRVVDQNAGAFDHIEVYAQEVASPRTYPRMVSGSDLRGLLSDLALHFGARFVDEVKEGPKDRINWRISGFKDNRPIAREDQKPTLQHLSDQTGLDFQVEKRKVRILMVERLKLAEE